MYARLHWFVAWRFSQFEIAFSGSTMCLCVCLFCLEVDMLSYSNVQICMPELIIQIQNTIQNRFILALAVWETLQICKSNPWQNQTTINNYLWFIFPKFCMQCRRIFQTWQTKVDLSIPECTMWYWQWHLVDA